MFPSACHPHFLHHLCPLCVCVCHSDTYHPAFCCGVFLRRFFAVCFCGVFLRCVFAVCFCGVCFCGVFLRCVFAVCLRCVFLRCFSPFFLTFLFSHDQPDQGGNLPIHYAASAGVSTIVIVGCAVAYMDGLEWRNKVYVYTRIPFSTCTHLPPPPPTPRLHTHSPTHTPTPYPYRFSSLYPHPLTPNL